MSTECVRTILHLSNDERMITGVGVVAAHHAAHAGLDQAACDSLAAGLEDFCRQTLPLLDGDDRLEVAIEEFADRLEIVIEHHGQASPSVGLDTFLHGGATASPTLLPGVRLLSLVDRVEYDSRNGVVRTRMVKHLRSGSTVR